MSSDKFWSVVAVIALSLVTLLLASIGASLFRSVLAALFSLTSSSLH